jgi:hypothetical protein
MLLHLRAPKPATKIGKQTALSLVKISNPDFWLNIIAIKTVRVSLNEPKKTQSKFPSFS